LNLRAKRHKNGLEAHSLDPLQFESHGLNSWACVSPISNTHICIGLLVLVIALLLPCCSTRTKYTIRRYLSIKKIHYHQKIFSDRITRNFEQHGGGRKICSKLPFFFSHFTSHEVLLPLLLPFHNLIFWFNLEYFALHMQDHGNNSKKLMCPWDKMHESLDTFFTKNYWLVHYICGLRSWATHFMKHIFKCHMVEAKQIFI
jgi:hypothetical protein